MRQPILDDFVINFIENHFDEIDLKKVEWNVKNKKQAIADIKNDDSFTGWIITEVMSWGTPVDYISKYMVENDEDNFIIKVNERYFALDYPHYFNEVFPEIITIEKLVFNNKQNE